MNLKKEIFYKSNNLCSIYPVEDNVEDREYLYNLFYEIGMICPRLYISSLRSNYDISPLLQRLYLLNDKFESIKYDKNWIDIQYDRNKGFQEVLSIVVDLWFNYEDNKFVFFDLSDSLLDEGELFHLTSHSWDTIVSRNISFVLMGGGLQADLWIGKSSSQNFNFLKNID